MAQVRKHRRAIALATLPLHLGTHIVLLSTLLGILGTTRRVCAESATTGAIRGVLKDSNTSTPLSEATVVITGPTLPTPRSAITDEYGAFTIATLPPGTYRVDYYYADAHVAQTNVSVVLARTISSDAKLDPNVGASQILVIKTDTPRRVVQGCAGLPLSKNFVATLPVVGRTTTTTPTAAAVQVKRSPHYDPPTRMPPYIVDEVRSGALNKKDREGHLSAANLCFQGLGQCAH